MNEVLKSICIFEKDENNDIMLTWSYPIVDKETETSLIHYLTWKNEKIENFIFIQLFNTWHYFLTLSESEIIIISSKVFLFFTSFRNFILKNMKNLVKPFKKIIKRMF
jgi:hypothetical protein